MFEFVSIMFHQGQISKFNNPNLLPHKLGVFLLSSNPSPDNGQDRISSSLSQPAAAVARCLATSSLLTTFRFQVLPQALNDFIGITCITIMFFHAN